MIKHKHFRESAPDYLFKGIGNTILILFTISIILPLIYVLVGSFIDPIILQNKGLSFNSEDWTLEAYRRVFANSRIWTGFLNSVIYSISFTFLSLLITLLAAFPMSLDDFRGKSIFNVFFIITMFFNGGLIPTYLLIVNLQLYNTIWAIILPGAFSVWNMIVARTYYRDIPKELREAAKVDGATDVVYFFKILMPVCIPLISTLAMWQFVGMWNSYFDALVYLDDVKKQPLQLVLRSILIQNQPEPGMIADISSTAERAQVGELLKYATIIVSSLPLIMIYPAFKKFFEGDLLVGAVKG